MSGLYGAVMMTKTILLISSESSVREVMQACLSHLGGWQVFGLASPSDGLQYAVISQPDAILFDLACNGMTFLSFLDALRAQPDTQNTPTVLVANGMKWLDGRPFQKFGVVGVIDDLSEPAMFPKQIARLLNWDETPQLVEVDQ